MEFLFSGQLPITVYVIEKLAYGASPCNTVNTNKLGSQVTMNLLWVKISKPHNLKVKKDNKVTKECLRKVKLEF